MKNPNSVKTLTNVELHNFLLFFTVARLGTKRHDTQARNLCMALLMADAGLRVGETVQLLQTDLMISEKPVKQLHITAQISKTKSERLIPLTMRTQSAIHRLRCTTWAYTDVKMPLFAFFTRDSTKHITVRQVERIFNAAGFEAIGRPVHPHMLRHTFGSKMMRITNASIVQELLGHKHLSSTQVYMHPNGDDLQNAIDSLNA